MSIIGSIIIIASTWAVLSRCLNHTVTVCSGYWSCRAWAAGVLWLGLRVSHRGVTSSTQGPPCSVPPIICSRQTAGKESISSVRQTPFMARTGAGTRMILLTLAWTLLTASQASGEVVRLVLAWLAQIIVGVLTQTGRRHQLCADAFCPVWSVLSKMFNAFFFVSLYWSLNIYFMFDQRKMETACVDWQVPRDSLELISPNFCKKYPQKQKVTGLRPAWTRLI